MVAGFFGAVLMAGKERSDGIQIFVAENRVDSVVGSKGTVQLKMVLDNSLMNVLTVCASHSGKLEEEKEHFWNELFHFVSCIP